jgi:hypothetical protein
MLFACGGGGCGLKDACICGLTIFGAVDPVVLFLSRLLSATAKKRITSSKRTATAPAVSANAEIAADGLELRLPFDVATGVVCG